MREPPAVAAGLVCVRKCRERGLLFLADRPEDLAAASGIAANVSGGDSRINIFVVCAGGASPAGFSGYPGLPPSMFATLTLARFNLRQLNVRAAVFAGDCRIVARPDFLEALRREAISTVNLAAEEGGDPTAAARMADELAIMMARDLKILREGGAMERLAATLLRKSRTSRMAKAVLSSRFQRLRTLDDVRERLSRPQTILCLGNGPSSEDPRLAGVTYDALFRVNHSWIKRGFLADPDVVFAGGRPMMRAVRGAIFGLQAEGAEARLVATKLLRPGRGKVAYFDVNDLTGSIASFPWGHLRPTNGASMLATAVALDPARLVIAGIDLFSDPKGSYPGDAVTANAYSPGHSRETELAFVLGLLDSYSGEVEIVGDVLSNEWHRHRQGKAKT